MAGVDFNRYAYAGNDPVNFSDPNGHVAGTPPDKAAQERRAEAAKEAARLAKIEAAAEKLRRKLSVSTSAHNKSVLKGVDPEIANRALELMHFYASGKTYPSSGPEVLASTKFGPKLLAAGIFGVAAKNTIKEGAEALAAKGASSLVTYIPSTGRKFNQLAQRGWSRDSINSLVNNPFTTRAATNRATGNAATAFVRADGHYVVRDNVTGDLVQMSDTRFSIGTAAGQWRPDSVIDNPFIPGP